jgi:hypothetical protein
MVNIIFYKNIYTIKFPQQNLCSITYILNYIYIFFLNFCNSYCNNYYVLLAHISSSNITNCINVFHVSKQKINVWNKSMFHLFSSPLPITLDFYDVQSCPMYNLLYTICHKKSYEKQFKSYLMIPLILPLTLPSSTFGFLPQNSWNVKHIKC